MEVKEVKLVDGAGGLNNRDHPSKLAQNEFSILENAITDEGGWGGKKRLGQQLMQYAPIQPTGWQGVDSIVSISGTNPGTITVECASTEHLKVGMLLSFYDATPDLLEGGLAVASIVDATHFTIVNTTAFSNGNKFKQTGTLHLWHMNAVSGDEADDTVFVHDETATKKDLIVCGTDPGSVVGLFPSASPLARLTEANPGGTTTAPTAKNFRTTTTNASLGINGLTSIMFDAWVYINPTFTGKPVIFADAYSSGEDVAFSNSGGHIVATQPYLATVSGYGSGGILDYGLARNGLSLWRDWDAVAGADASDPYITFALKTTGSGSQTLTSKYLPTGCWLFVRGSYIQSSGKMRLTVNGGLHAESVASGAVDDSTDGISGSELLVGGTVIRIDNGTPYNAGVVTGLDARIEEVRVRTSITEAEEAAFPFLEPRGKPWTLNKADGTKQLVVGAGDSLFYTVGDAAWTQMNSAAKDVVGVESFSTTAFWDGIQIGDVLFLQNGVDNPKAWDGTKLYPWGNGTKTLTLTKKTTAAGGLGVTGDVTYYYTYQYGNYETGPSVLTKVNLTAATDEVEIDNIPLGAPGCTGRKIYRVKSGVKYLVRIISDNTTVKLSGAFSGVGSDPATDTGQDGLANTVLGTGKYVEMLAEVEFSAIPKGKYLLANYNRAFIVSVDDPYSVFWTELNAPHVSLALSYVKAESDSGPIIGLAKYYGEVHASKNGKATLVLRGDSPSNWTQWEILHPTIGAIDHWSYVHRTIPQSDSYRLCFWGEDGAYAYAGQDFEKISDRIIKTVNGLAIENSNRAAVTVTTEADWKKAPGNNGSISVNAYTPSYETDGLREGAGQLRSVDQLDYIGLWNPITPPNAALTGNVIAVCKGPAEGEFYFSTDAAKTLWRTTDNFVTAMAIGAGTNPLATGERIIEIVRRGTDNFYFLITDTAGTGSSSGGGRVHAIENPATAPSWTSGTDTLFYDLDVPVTMTAINPNTNVIANISDGVVSANPFGGTSKYFYALGSVGAGLVYQGPNIYINHAQTISIQKVSPSAVRIYSNSSLYGAPSGTIALRTTDSSWAFTPGFYSMRDSAVQSQSPPYKAGFFDTSTNGLSTTFTRREFPYWRGGKGTFRPQAYWDATVGALFFLASTAEDSNGNRLTYFRSATSGLAVTTYTAVGSCVSALAFDASSGAIYLWDNISTSSNGFNGYTKSVLRTSPNAIVKSVLSHQGMVAIRLLFQPGTSNIVLLGKYLNVLVQDYCTRRGYVGNVSASTFAVTSWARAASIYGADSGTTFCEIARQSSTPNACFILANEITVAEYAQVYILPATTTTCSPLLNSPYIGAGSIAPATTCISPLIFVPASGSAGNYLWADRLYWFAGAALAADARMLQLGVPGSWTVVVDYVSQAFATGGFNAFEALASDYQGSVDFYLRNAASTGALAASELAVTPNSAITNFPAPASIIQFRLALEWVYAESTVSPYVDFVDIGYYAGSVNVPRVVGWHWKGRTYWSVAQLGQTRNNLVVVYQKNNTWTLYTGWYIKGTAEFLGKLVALQAFELVQLEVGKKDLGNLIRSKRRTGYIMDDQCDKCIRYAHANVSAFVNSRFPTKGGWMKLIPYSADEPLDANWVFEIPAAPTEEPRQVLAASIDAIFPYEYARAFAVEVFTSDETGDYAPVVDQTEDLASLMLQLFVSHPRKRLTRN